MSRLRICLLTDQDLSQDPFPKDDWPCDPRPYLPAAEWEVAVLERKSAVKRVLELSSGGFDLFFNLCDGAWDEGRPGIEVVRTLERLGLPFTGADSAFYEPSREAMKRVCRAWDVPTPRYVAARTPGDLERAADTLRFPLIVKHPSSYASAGLTPASRVETREALVEQGRLMMEAYAGALVEEFVEGTECTVLVAENPDDSDDPVTYTPVRYRFPEGERFKHERLKWVDFEGLEAELVDDPELDTRLREVSARFFRGMRGRGYGRCDLRVDAEGVPYMLEINPNCGLYYPPHAPSSADLVLQRDPEGHEGFTRRVVEAALKAHEARRRGWQVRSRPSGDYGLFATRPAAPGDRLIVFEGSPHHLVTRSHVEAAWTEPRRSWFERYAWPLTEEVWVTWSDEPEAWRPVNHSCEPTAWLDGLDVVARLPLDIGEEITLDYATFVHESMPPFECTCGADVCRGTVRGSDILGDAVERYGEHVSDYVKRRRARRADRP